MHHHALSSNESGSEDRAGTFFRDIEIGEFDVDAVRFRPTQIMR